MTSDCLLICVFTCFYQFLHDVTMKLFCFDLENSFMITSCKNREINKQSDVKFWLNWRKYGTVSYSFSCTFLIYLTVKLRVLIRLVCKHMQAFIDCLWRGFSMLIYCDLLTKKLIFELVRHVNTRDFTVP